jgi:ADP-ribose pyrophosphatase
MAKKNKLKKTAKAEVKSKDKKKAQGKAQVLSSELVFESSAFNVYTDRVIEPGGREAKRDIVRHNGSVVILAVDDSKSKKDPMVVMERQYRHAAGQYLWEIPAGKIDEGEKRLPAAKRELLEETGYRAKKWTKLVRYYPSPGFVGEWMQIFLAEGLTSGDAQPEDDEEIELFLMPLSAVLKMIDHGDIMDGKTLIAAQFYDRIRPKRNKSV